MFDQCNTDGAYVRWSSIPHLSKNLGGVVTWVAFVVALVAACIPLGREGEVRSVCSFDLFELYVLSPCTRDL
jgi:hypothetical protein